MDLTRLRYFLAVAETLHFKKAAEQLMITPPPLSKQIRLLELELGGELFERNYHHVSLTPLGKGLVEPAREILARVDDFQSLAEELSRHVHTFRIGATAYAPSTILDHFERAIEGLPANYATAFQISGSAAEVTAQLLSGQLDLGFIHLPVTDDRLDVASLERFRGAAAMRGDDPLAAQSVLTVDDLRDRQIVLDFARPNPTLLAYARTNLVKLGLTNIVQASATNRGSEVEIAAQVKRRGLIAFVSDQPGSTLGRIFAPPEFALVPIEESLLAGEVGIAWDRQRARRHPGITALADALVQEFTRTSSG
jgi:DNA-binding transcriptional LysR family regulator